MWVLNYCSIVYTNILLYFLVVRSSYRTSSFFSRTLSLISWMWIIHANFLKTIRKRSCFMNHNFWIITSGMENFPVLLLSLDFFRCTCVVWLIVSVKVSIWKRWCNFCSYHFLLHTHRKYKNISTVNSAVWHALLIQENSWKFTDMNYMPDIKMKN